MLYLKNHIYTCLSQGHLILLDTKKDQYHILEPQDLANLAHSLAGINDLINCRVESETKPPPALISWLKKNDLVTVSPCHGKAVHPGPPLISPDEEIGLEMTLDSFFSYRHLPLAGAAVTISFFRKYMFPLKYVLSSIKKRKQNKKPRVYCNDVIRLTSIFHNIRPILPFRRNCYLDSLALLEFLGYYDIQCDLVFGVLADPFYAHCWVEWNALCLNDRSDVPSALIPILRV